MSAYDDYVRNSAEYVTQNKQTTDFINKSEIPQHILWKKNVANSLINETAKYATIDGTFYFTEALVNKLMYFAYLDGSKAMDETSYNKGYAECRADMLSKLGIFEED